MKNYKVKITEMLEMSVNIKANSQAEAEKIAETNWKNEQYVLDSDNFTGATFNANCATSWHCSKIGHQLYTNGRTRGLLPLAS